MRAGAGHQRTVRCSSLHRCSGARASARNSGVSRAAETRPGGCPGSRPGRPRRSAGRAQRREPGFREVPPAQEGSRCRRFSTSGSTRKPNSLTHRTGRRPDTPAQLWLGLRRKPDWSREAQGLPTRPQFQAGPNRGGAWGAPGGSSEPPRGAAPRFPRRAGGLAPCGPGCKKPAGPEAGSLPALHPRPQKRQVLGSPDPQESPAGAIPERPHPHPHQPFGSASSSHAGREEVAVLPSPALITEFAARILL